MKDKYKTKSTEYGEGYGNGYKKGVGDTEKMIGLEFKKWFERGYKELIEDAIERITGVKVEEEL